MNGPYSYTYVCHLSLRISIIQLLCLILDVFFDGRASPIIVNFWEPGQ